MTWEESFEIMVKGALVLAGLAAFPVVIGFLALLVAPFAVGLAVTNPHFSKKRREIAEENRKRLLEERRWEEQRKAKEREREKRWAQLMEAMNVEPKTALDDNREEKPVEEEYDLSAPLHLDNQLTFYQKERLYAKGYQVLKTSAFGDSGAAHYWVMPRHNESKEHAFFCYILDAELKKYVEKDKIELNATNGPDVVVSWKGKRYGFDVETGKSLSRQPEWLEKKFAYYQKEYDKSFILVTKRTLKYKYAKYGIVITRGLIKETIKKLFRKQMMSSPD